MEIPGMKIKLLKELIKELMMMPDKGEEVGAEPKEASIEIMDMKPKKDDGELSEELSEGEGPDDVGDDEMSEKEPGKYPEGEMLPKDWLKKKKGL